MANSYSLDLEASSTQYASIADASQTGLDLSGDFTFEAWVNFETLPGSGGQYNIINKGGHSTPNLGYLWGLFNSAGTYTQRVVISSDGQNYDDVRVNLTAPTTGVWYHWAVTCDISNGASTEFEFFVDGVSLGNGTVANDNSITSISNRSEAFEIGRVPGFFYYDGLIDEVRVWNVIRTSSQIASNRYKDVTGQSGLKGYWKLNNNYTDSSGNGNTLTASGSPVFSSTVPFTAYRSSTGFIPFL